MVLRFHLAYTIESDNDCQWSRSAHLAFLSFAILALLSLINSLCIDPGVSVFMCGLGYRQGHECLDSAIKQRLIMRMGFLCLISTYLEMKFPFGRSVCLFEKQKLESRLISTCFTTLTFGHELWIVTEIRLSIGSAFTHRSEPAKRYSGQSH